MAGKSRFEKRRRARKLRRDRIKMKHARGSHWRWMRVVVERFWRENPGLGFPIRSITMAAYDMIPLVGGDMWFEPGVGYRLFQKGEL